MEIDDGPIKVAGGLPSMHSSDANESSISAQSSTNEEELSTATTRESSTLNSKTAAKRYASKLPYYSGEQGNFKAWRRQLLEEFKFNATRVKSNDEKVHFIKDHCKEAAFDLIKTGFDLAPQLIDAEQLLGLFGAHL